MGTFWNTRRKMTCSLAMGYNNEIWKSISLVRDLLLQPMLLIVDIIQGLHCIWNIFSLHYLHAYCFTTFLYIQTFVKHCLNHFLNSNCWFWILPCYLYELWNCTGFTGIDDPYEPPINCEVCVHGATKVVYTFLLPCMVCYVHVCGLTWSSFFQIEIKQENGDCPTPTLMAGQVVTYLENKGFLES